MSQSVAFKCTYNNGGEDVFVGFAGTCSRENIEHNIRIQKTWCMNKGCQCSGFYKGGFKGATPVDPCMESKLFREWVISAGGYHNGPKAGQPIPLTGTEKGKFAILTTRFPNEAERERRIIGLFQIESIKGKNEVYAARRGRIRLPLDEAKELYYWSYSKNKAKIPDWRTGMFRYLADSQVHRILADVADTVQDEQTKREISYLIQRAFGTAPAPPAAGYLSERSETRNIEIAKRRKYGRGGEGKDHKELKEWIAENPKAIGLKNVIKCECDNHRFLSGDLPDLIFTHRDGTYTVIEIETVDPMPGAHQTIKYRTLLSAEKRLSLDTKKVKGILIAWSVPQVVQDFCTDYGIGFREYKLP